MTNRTPEIMTNRTPDAWVNIRGAEIQFFQEYIGWLQGIKEVLTS
jgi:hypothetical protein